MRPLSLALAALSLLGCQTVTPPVAASAPHARVTSETTCVLHRVQPVMLASPFLVLDERAELRGDEEARSVQTGPSGSDGRTPSVTVVDLPDPEDPITVTLLPYHTGSTCVVSSRDAFALDGRRAYQLDISACGEGFFADTALLGELPGGTLHRLDATTRMMSHQMLAEEPHLASDFSPADIADLRRLPDDSHLWQLHDESPSFPYVVVILAGGREGTEHRVRETEGSLVRGFENERVMGILVRDDASAEILTTGARAPCRRWEVTRR